MVKSIRILEAGHCHHPERMVRGSGPLGLGKFPANVVVIDHPKEGIILFDTGYGSDFNQVTARMPEMLYRLITPVNITPETTAQARLKELGIKREDVKHVILSHIHADHIGGVKDFPQATYHADLPALSYYRGLSKFNQVRSGFLAALLPQDFDARLKPFDSTQFKSGNFGLGNLTWGHDLFSDGSIMIIPLPGHMKGHVGIQVLTQSGEKYLFVADAAWRKESITENSLPSMVTRLIISDWSAYGKTLHELHDLHHRYPDLKIIPCHCETHIA
jgi:glyoxylase-like metal-dependent hydrolase (beta-lactamase superfamily II)